MHVPVSKNRQIPHSAYFARNGVPILKKFAAMIALTVAVF